MAARSRTARYEQYDDVDDVTNQTNNNAEIRCPAATPRAPLPALAPRQESRRSLLTPDSSFAQQPPFNYQRQPSFAHSDPPLKRRNMFDFIATKWAKAFFLTTAVQAIICLAFEAYVFAEFESNVSQTKDNSENSSFYRSIPTFLTLFIFAFLYELVLVWDALRMKNTIQVIGICIANLAFLIYTAIQTDQIKLAIDSLSVIGAVNPAIGNITLWERCRPFLVAIPCVIGLGTIFMGFIAYKLYQEFAWDILKQIGADLRMKRRYLHYQIYIALLKFDFFFFLGFTVQFLVIVTGKTNVEFALTAAAIPITIAILLMAAFFTRHEIKIGMALSIVLYLCGLAWFFFKLVRIYQPGYKQNYTAVRKSLTAFAVLTILLIILTITNAFICMQNFGNGLKAYILRRDNAEKSNQYDVNSIGLSDVKPPLPSRMTID
ncbi:hypothetical protein SPI_02772 [Niveomyces insectorum RCEF 264]|uniref:Uncharacterized protein n=1 Tax=Niveomyces insectorum RCEF 264 TaxID=1081102 RepID=A0A167Y8R9_9HYPO|nr:hypothetical protein SPI_02772 [Niveomyces insectorum RCEF 264]